MKAYTDLEQSRKLAEFLPLESADMWWVALNWQETEYYVEVKQDGINQPKKAIPCWSLTALLDIIPFEVSLNSFKDGNWNVMVQHAGKMIYDDNDNPVDACVAMIEKLHELKML